MARLLVTRPQPHAAGTAAALSALGHAPVLSPMLEVVPCADARLSLEGVGAVALSSRSAAEAAAALARTRPDLAALFAIPVFTVGAATAAAAHAAGFEEVLSAEGDVADLERLIRLHRRPGEGAVVHLAGAVRAGDLEAGLVRAGFAASTVVVYEAVPAKLLSEDAATALSAGRLDAALVYSGRTAAAFAAAAEASGLRTALMDLPCLGLSRAALAPLAAVGVRTLRSAAEPNESALFALLPRAGFGP